MATSSILRVEHLRRHRAGGLAEVCLDVEALEFKTRSLTVLAGPPGSGAGLLLRMLGLLERPDEGEIFLDGMATAALDEAGRVELRNREFGFVFADPFLLEAFSVAENIAIPLFKISGLDLETARQRAMELLDFAGLTALADDPVDELNPLLQQKLALARALANAPRVLIVEDPFELLTEAARAEFFACLRDARDMYGITAVVRAAEGIAGADRIVRLDSGRIVMPGIPGASGAPAEEARAHE